MCKKIAAFGEVVMRLEVPNYERLTQANSLKYSFSGTGVNVVSALANFGHEGYLVSTLPQNPLGDAAIAHLRKLGVLTSYIHRSGDFIRMYFLEKGYGPRPSRVTNSSRHDSSFNIACEEAYDFEKIAKHVDVIHFCGITLAMNDRVRHHMKSLAKAVRKNGGTVLFDCNYREGLWGGKGYEKAKPHYEEMLFLSDIVMMNENDAKYILGLETKETEREAQMIDLLPRVSKQYHIQTIAGTHRTINSNFTHSLKGFIYKDGNSTFTDVFTFPVLDRIGGGDAYTSGIIHGALTGFSSEKTAAFAATASMLAHTTTGDTPLVTEEEVLNTMQISSRDIER